MSATVEGRGRRIVVADDSALQRLVIGRRLERLGFVVVAAADAAEALALVEAQPPDAVVTDMQMQPMDGLELCRRLKNDPRFAGIPVIVSSVSDPSSDNVARSLEAGADAYAARTADLDAVIDALARALA